MVNTSGGNTWGVKRSFKTPQILKTKKIFEKIYYDCTLLRSFFCFKNENYYSCQCVSTTPNHIFSFLFAGKEGFNIVKA